LLYAFFLKLLISIHRSQSPAQAAHFVFIGRNQAEPAGNLVNLSLCSLFRVIAIAFLHKIVLRKTVICDQLAESLCICNLQLFNRGEHWEGSCRGDALRSLQMRHHGSSGSGSLAGWKLAGQSCISTPVLEVPNQLQRYFNIPSYLQVSHSVEVYNDQDLSIHNPNTVADPRQTWLSRSNIH
jgi:hypothetical protein